MSKTRKRTVTAGKMASPAISPLMIGIVAVAAILIVGGLIALGNMGNQPTANIDLSAFPSKGNAKAQVTMVEYSDYGCPHCRDFALEKLPLLEAEYIDTGKLKYVVHSYNLGRPETALAAEAAWCTADQNKFFEYKQALFENQGTVFGQGNLVDLAARTGLNRDTFSQCLSSGTHRTDVENARLTAISKGINSTPTFFVNNQRIEGNVPYEEFKRVIDQELAKSQQ